MAKTTSSAYTYWKGHITFGLISVPVKLHAAARAEGVSFNQVHQHSDGSACKINQKNFCPTCNMNVEYASLEKGYEISDGKFVIIGENDLKSLAKAKSETIEVTSFVPMSEVDPIYFDSSFFVVAQDAGRKAYEMLYRTMNNTGLGAQAKLVVRGKEYNILLRTYGKGIMIHTLFAEAEVRDLVEFNAYRDDITVSDAELELGKMLLESLIEPFNPKALVNKYNVKVEAMIERKISGDTTPEAAPEPMPSKSVDLMAALQASLAKKKAEKVAA